MFSIFFVIKPKKILLYYFTLFHFNQQSPQNGRLLK